MNTQINPVSKLKYIKSTLKQGDQNQLAQAANVNEGKLSQYLIRPESFDLNPCIVAKIIKAYDGLFAQTD